MVVILAALPVVWVFYRLFVIANEHESNKHRRQLTAKGSHWWYLDGVDGWMRGVDEYGELEWTKSYED